MKKTSFYTILAASAVMMLTGCSQSDIVESQTGKEAVVSFNVTAPNGMQTRSFGDGSTAKKLHYAVYNKAGNLISEYGIKEADFNNQLQTSVSLQLVKGDQYSVVFWADAGDDSLYTVDWANKKMSLGEDVAAKANDETRDAFYKKVTFVVVGDANRTVELTRPFAQLNIGTNDMAESTAAGFTPGKTQVTVSGVPNTLDLFTGNVSGSATITYEYTPLPNGEDFPVTGYDYLSMNYILMGADKTTTDVTFDYDAAAGGAEHQRTFASVPVQRNYRTNIYGSLLTNQEVFNVTITPAFETPAHDVKVVSSSAELATEALTEGAHIQLKTNDTYAMPTTIANGVTIEGNGAATVLQTPGTQYAAGVQNLTFKNLTVKESNSNYTGIVHSDNLVYENCVIEGMPFGYATHLTYNNCTFKQTSSSNYNLWTYASNATFNNCKFECAGKAALVYRETSTEWLTVTFNDCEFTASAPVEGKAAIEIDSHYAPFEVHINNCTATGFGTGNTSGNSLWNNKNATEASNANLKVYVDNALQTLNVKQ